MPAFDAAGVVLLGLTLGLLVVSILFFRRVRWARIATSILLHVLTLTLAVSLLYTIPISYLDALRICVTHPGRLETTWLSEAYFAFAPDLAGQTPWELYTQDDTYEGQLKEVLDGNYYLRDGLAAIGQCIRVGWRLRVDAEATVTGLAVFLYKVEKNRLPESLRQLVDAGLLQNVPMDPYSGSPLVYRVTRGRVHAI